MSNWINWRIAVCRTRELSTTAKGLALYLNTYMNDRQDMAWPGISTICGEMNMARATAIKYLNELTEKGFLAKQKRFAQTTIRHATIPISSNLELVQELNRSSSNLSTPVVQSTDPNNQLNKQMNKQDYAREEIVIDGLDLAAWSEYMEHRKEIRARKLKQRSVEKLQAWLAEQDDQQAIVDQTIRNGYTGLFELKGKVHGTNKDNHGKSATERNANLHEYLNRKISGTA